MREIIFVESVASGYGAMSIEAAHQSGLAVAFFTKDPEFYRVWGMDHPLAGVERVVTTDTSSAEEMSRHALPPRTAGVIALDDFHVEPAVRLAALLGLPHPTLSGVRHARHKDLVRNLLRERGHLRPSFRCFGDGEEPLDSPIGYPCVLKPSDGTGSVGVHLCNDRAALQAAMSSVRARCRTIRDYDLSRRWMIEEYVDGPEYSAEMIWQDRQWHLIGVTKKTLSPPPFFIEIGHVFPAPIERARVEIIRDTCRMWLEAIGLDFGAAHIEFRMTDDGPVLMEINPRLAGGMIPELVRLATGFEPLKRLFSLYTDACTGPPFAPPAPKSAAAIRFLLAEHSGVIADIRGRDEALAVPGVTRCTLRPTPLAIHASESCYDRLGFVIAQASTAAEAELRAICAMERLSVIYVRESP